MANQLLFEYKNYKVGNKDLFPTEKDIVNWIGSDGVFRINQELLAANPRFLELINCSPAIKDQCRLVKA